ncbi:MAG: hypothetical protein ACLGGV_07725 [Bacteroidia bacterium]
MKPFSVLANLVTNADGSRTLEYSVFAPGKRIKEKTITQTQVTTCGPDSVPGIKIVAEFEEVGPGSPFSFDGFITINPALILDSNNPYLELKAVDGDYNGGMIIRNGNGN